MIELLRPYLDHINALFEGVGAVSCWLNVLRIRRDRQVKGVLWYMQAWWCLWGLWNLIYYAGVQHSFSFWGGAVLVAGNITWTAHAAWYAYRRKHENCLDCGDILIGDERSVCRDCGGFT